MREETRMRNLRARWAAVGAAVAVTLGAGGVGLSYAEVSSGDKPIFVPITPCRLIDTRGNVGTRTTPLSAGESLTLTVTGSTGECSGIPSDATAAALNVTAIQGSTTSFLTVYPADASSVPNASSLNWRSGDGATPNKVDVKLSSAGAVKMRNAFGTVHVAADLVGYYVDHTHDDRYYTKSVADSAIATKADAADVYTKSEVDALLAASSASIATAPNVGTVPVGTSQTVVTSATINPSGAGEIIALAIATGAGSGGASSYDCSLSESAGFGSSIQTQALGQITTAQGFSTTGTSRTVNLVCAADAGTVNFTGVSLRLIFFPD